MKNYNFKNNKYLMMLFLLISSIYIFAIIHSKPIYAASAPYPQPPSQEQLDKWKAMGRQNELKYSSPTKKVLPSATPTVQVATPSPTVVISPTLNIEPTTSITIDSEKSKTTQLINTKTSMTIITLILLLGLCLSIFFAFTKAKKKH